jgi:hypothetical protein
METNQVKVIMNEKNKVMCDSCEHYFDSPCVTKNKNGYNYCKSCNHMQESAKKYCEPIDKKGFDKMLKMALDTPPLTFKDLDIVKK